MFQFTGLAQGAYIWLGLTMWLAMHACLRANAATTHMLTRFVRYDAEGFGCCLVAGITIDLTMDLYFEQLESPAMV
jgi:hypothetical protein